MKCKNLIAACMCGFLAMVMSMTTFAADKETGSKKTGVCFVINADKGTNFSNDDRIEVTIMNNSLQKETTIEFCAKEALDYSQVDLPEGHYSVRGVKYLGDNANLQNEDIAITSKFVADMDYDLVYMAMGNVSRESLVQEYYDVFLVEPDGEMEIAGKENPEKYLNEAQRRQQADLEDGVVPKKNYKDPEIIETEEVGESEEEQEDSTQGNRLWGLFPIAVIGVVGGVTLYILRKKKIL